MARPKAEDMLSVEEILAIAREQFGLKIAPTSIRDALTAGRIEGAVKVSIGWAKTERGGQWRAPRGAVLVYLSGYTPRRRAEGAALNADD